MTQLAARQNGGEMDIQTLGAVLVKSGFFADTREQAQAIVKVLAGRELGFGPIASMQGVYIVKGRVTLSANLVGAAIQRSGKYGYEIVTLTDDECELHFYSTADPRKRADGFTSRFTIEDAKKAGILSENYRKFPRNMLFSRALTNGARWYCPEVFNGPIYTPDELGAETDDEGDVVALPTVETRPDVDTSTGEIIEADVVAGEPDQPAARICVQCEKPIEDAVVDGKRLRADVILRESIKRFNAELCFSCCAKRQKEKAAA
jgi:hypothetical protein